MVTAPLSVAFDCSLAVSPEALELRLEVVNNGPVEVAVLDRLRMPRPDGTVEFPSDAAYVTLEGGVLVVRRRILTPLPGRRPPPGYEPAYASRLGPGQRASAVLRFGLPLLVLDPLRAAALAEGGQVAAARPATATALAVEVGVLAMKETLQFHAEHPAFPDVFTVFPAGQALAAQQVLTRSPPLPRPIPVLDYLVAPWPS